MSRFKKELPEGTYIELVRSLFSTLLTTIIMTISFVSVGLLVTSRSPDRPLVVLTVLGSVAALGRIAVLVLHRRRASDEALDLVGAQTIERRYALIYFIFAGILGAFVARAFVVALPHDHMIVTGLLFGYGAGVAAGLSLRPWIAVPSMLLATVPAMFALFLSPDMTHWATGMLLAAFTGGGIRSMLLRYWSEGEKITLRRLFTTLARHDDLTNLPNRLWLREWFSEFGPDRANANIVVVFCLDLDRFKPVNDRLGHAVGDALLQAVAGRLNGLLRSGDFASRIGGDEFVVVQTAVKHLDEAEMLARRIARAIALPYSIDGHEIVIGTSIGYAISPDQGTDLDELMSLADAALCQVKRQGGGIAAYREPLPEEKVRLSA